MKKHHKSHSPPTPATCLHCGSRCEQQTGRDLYGADSKWGDDKIYWVCPVCPDSRVGSHPNGEPFGRAADRETRQARRKLHSILDPIWMAEGGSPSDRSAARREVYEFMSLVMGEEIHIGNLSIEECRDLWPLIAGESMKSIRKFLESERKRNHARTY